mmetsp:Transcript_35664/g.32144  ORF Transcript_35664/g.32144 Transcript_35664/m.32144 type:complete len:128 (+) Transcript_35664:333-716(+)
MIPRIPVQRSADGSVFLKNIVDYLIQEAFPLYDSKIFYYSPNKDIYMYCGGYNSISSDYLIPYEDIHNGQIKLKIRKNVSSRLSQLQQETISDEVKSSQVEEAPKDHSQMLNNIFSLSGNVSSSSSS